jgi:hypothetical protein
MVGECQRRDVALRDIEPLSFVAFEVALEAEVAMVAAATHCGVVAVHAAAFSRMIERVEKRRLYIIERRTAPGRNARQRAKTHATVSLRIADQRFVAAQTIGGVPMFVQPLARTGRPGCGTERS